MREHRLLATQTVHKVKRTAQGRKPRAERPRQYWRKLAQGVRGRGLKLISYNDSQLTAASFMRDMATLVIEQIFK